MQTGTKKEYQKAKKDATDKANPLDATHRNEGGKVTA